MSSTQLELEPVRLNEGQTSQSLFEAIEISPSHPAASAEPAAPSKTRSAALIATLACASFLNTFNSGTLTVALPSIAKQLDLPDNLLLWPASVYALGLSCTLLLMGAIADVVGNRPVFLLGSILYTACTLAVSLSQTGAQLIVFRALQGIAMSFCMPTAVSIITSTFPSGKPRNFAFAVFGGGSPLGFAIGLVLGGVFVQVSGWRTAYYLATGINAVATILAWFTLPKTTPVENVRDQFLYGFDWVGVISANACLALLSYIFAQVTYSGNVMKQAHNIALLVIAVLLIPFFIFWVGRQERLGRPAIISNSIWQKREFSIVCITVFLVWSWFNAFGYWTTLFFQVTQGLDALGAAVRFLPMVIVGLATNVVAGFVMDKISAGKLVLVGSLLSAASPLLFALQDPEWTYWAAGFPAMCLSVVSTDLLFNVSNLVITSSFPSKDQALAGGVFNTVTQLGNSVGPAITAIIASSVTHTEMGESKGVNEADATLKGYRSALWTCFGLAVVSGAVSTVGLRKAGKVGMKKDV
ncbi:integral membrane protein [Thelonectria olida]|uniref:Integral membrane protein n=1 Tax=Thelonectria olida TaxID=1576542 RepID=A0A9P8WGA8_9HYPO|nr:integral membrane protein [Thelonectria olida]